MDTNWSHVATDLRTIALLNPRLALMLARGQPLTPRAYNITAEFDAVTQGQRIPSSMDERLYQSVWIQDLAYTIRCPDANAGAMGKLWADENRKLNPYIDVDIRIEGTERYQLTEGLTPIENIATSGTSSQRRWAKNGWTLGTDQNMFCDFVLQRTLNEDEVPLTVTLTLSVMELSGCALHQISWQDSVCALRGMNILPAEGDI